MELNEANFIESVQVVIVDGNPVDAILLADGRVLAIDGASVTLFDDLDSLLEADEDEDDGDDGDDGDDEDTVRPSIEL